MDGLDKTDIDIISFNPCFSGCRPATVMEQAIESILEKFQSLF